MSTIVYEHGEGFVTVPVSQKIQVYSLDIVQIYVKSNNPNQVPAYSLLYTSQPGEVFTSSAFSAQTIVKLNAGAALVQYAVGVTPVISQIVGPITATSSPFNIQGVNGVQGGAIQILGGNSTDPQIGNFGGAVTIKGGTGGPIGYGGSVILRGGNGGSTSGVGGNVTIVGGSALAGNSNGGSVILFGGPPNGTGYLGSVLFSTNTGQPTVIGQAMTDASKTVSSTLTPADLVGKTILINQGAGAASAQQLPLASDMDIVFHDFVGGTTLEFLVINRSTVAAEAASITTNTGWTLIGAMDIPAYSAAGSLNSSARFWARRVTNNTWTLYRA